MTLVELTLFGIPLILISSAMLGFFTAYGVGANDVANAMGTSVGSKVLTIKQAVLVAAVFEFLGAFLAGGGVTQTIRKGVIDHYQNIRVIFLQVHINTFFISFINLIRQFLLLLPLHFFLIYL